MSTFNLLHAQVGVTIRIYSFEGGKPLAAKLRQYGLFLGDLAQVLRLAPLGGPMLLQVNGREIALGRRIAAKIIVEEL